MSAIDLVAKAATVADLAAAGKGLRGRVPRASHARWKVRKDREDLIGILRASDAGRIAELVPLRYGRMVQSPFAFYRGSAGVMAADLAVTPNTGAHVQVCGDCHLLNFGGFATPERRINFDINDFDETLPAPWEWDVKRLAASFVLAARSNGFPDATGREAAVACARSYRKRLRDVAEMSPLEAWYAHIGLEEYLDLFDDPKDRRRIRHLVEKTREKQASELDCPEVTRTTAGLVQIKDQPPLIYHMDVQHRRSFPALAEETMAAYRQSLPRDRQVLFDRYRYVDGAIKVVGIGSVGRYCSIGLFLSSADEPLFLQFKQAGPSVLEPYAGKSVFAHAGERVVEGQRLMQASSDIFLGHTVGPLGNVLYVRQLRDAKIKPRIETFDRGALESYGRACGWALARAHGKSGHPWLIAGYLGKGDQFDEAMGDFALAYADQAERDHALLKAAVKAGDVKARTEGEK